MAVDVVAHRAAQLHRARAPFFQWGIVEVGERIGVEDLVAEDRRFRRIDRHGLHRSGLDLAQNGDEPVEIHRLVQTVRERLAHEHVIGNADRPGEVLGTGGLIGEDRRHQIVGAHADQLRRHSAPTAEAQNRERPRRIPAPARGEHRRRKQGLGERLLGAGRTNELEDGVERKRVLIGQRKHDAVIGRGRLQLEVERAAELFAQRQSPRAVDARAERRVQDQLHPAALVEEALRDQRPVRRHDAEDLLAGAHVRHGLFGAGGIERALFLQPRDRRFVGALVDRDANRADLARQLDRAPSPFSVPKRDRGRRAVRIFDAHDARLDAPDLPRVRAQQEDIAGHAFDGKILVERTDHVPLRLDDDVEVRSVGDSAAAGDRGQPRAAPRPELAVDAIVVQEGSAASARGRDAVGEHRDDRVEIAAIERAIGERPAHEREERFDLPFVLRARGDDLLREDIERRFRDLERVERTAANPAHERRTLDQFVARRDVEDSFGQRAYPVAGAPDALQRHRDRSRRAELHHKVDRADVDAELERGGCDDRSQLPIAQTLLHVEAKFSRQAAVMRHHEAFPETLVEREGDAFAHPPGADEDQRRAMRADLLGDAIVDLAPHLFARDRTELVAGNFDAQLHLAAVSDVDRRRPIAQKSGDVFERPHRRREPDALRLLRPVLLDQVIEACERQRQMRAALVGRHGVDFVDDHRLHAGEERARLFRGQQDEERLRRRHQHVRGLAQHALALRRRRIPGAYGRANRRHSDAALDRQGRQRAERLLEVLADVVGQGLQGRNVDDERLLGQRSGDRPADEIVEAEREGRERLARAGRRRD